MIFDLHNDILTAGMSPSKLDLALQDYESCNLAKAVLVYYTTTTGNPTELLSNLLFFKERIIKSNKLFLAIEDLHFLNKDNITTFFEAFTAERLAYASLTWNEENSLGGGAYSNSSLTEFGKEVLSMLEDNDITVDCAHLNARTFWDVIRHTKKTVINSHCCFSGVHEHPRNISDDQIKALIERGGIIGLTLVPSFLSKNPLGLVDFFKHIDYFINSFGYNNLAIGTDFFGCDRLIGEISKYSDFNEIAELMSSYGYPKIAIRSILFENAANFFKSSALSVEQ